MRARYFFLAFCIILGVGAVILILTKGKPENKADLSSVMRVAESVVYDIHKVGNLSFSLTDEEEMQVGEKIWQNIGSRYSLAAAAEGTDAQKYLDSVGAKVSENVKRKGIKYTFHMVDGYWPNAFAVPGGHILITTGLLKSLRSEAELAAILGHEIVHVDARHAIGSIPYKIKLGKVTGADIDDIARAGAMSPFRHAYSEVEEDESDIGGVYLAYKAGYHPDAAISAFKRVNEWQAHGRDGSLTPVGDTFKAVFGMVGRYFGTHPLTDERIDKIRKFEAENKIVDGTARMYVGEKNYKEAVPSSVKLYKEEFKAQYPDIKEPEEKVKKEKLFILSEVNTVYGKISSGMTREECLKLLPEWSKTLDSGDKIEFKNVGIYVPDMTEVTEEMKLSVSIEDGKVSHLEISSE